MAWRTPLRAAALLTLASLLLSAVVLPAAAQHKTDQVVPVGSKHDAKADDAKKHNDKHQITAAEEVGDRRGRDKAGNPEPWYIFHELHISLPLVGWFEIAGHPVPSKYMWLMLIAAVLTFVIYRGLARRVAHGEVPQGPFWNFFETLLTFIREQVAKPNFPEHHDHGHGHGEGHGHTPEQQIPAAHGGQSLAAGHGTAAVAHAPPHAHPADAFVPLLWTLFVYILFCNLLGLFPFMGSPTANIFMTGGLALCVFIVLHGAALVKHGPIGYVKVLWPKIDLPAFYGLGWLFAFVIKLMIFVIELFGTIIKSGVLAIRLFANMFAGHMVLASILLFIVAAGNSPLWPVVTVASVLGVIALSLLELFVAFLQAYIFTFLTALFIGMAVNPEH